MTAEVSAHELLTLQGAEGVEFDVLFLRLMVRHHEDGIAMARNASAFVRMPKIRKIANDFIYQQEHELAQMDRLITSYGAQSSTLPLPELPAFAMCKGQQLPE